MADDVPVIWEPLCCTSWGSMADIGGTGLDPWGLMGSMLEPTASLPGIWIYSL